MSYVCILHSHRALYLQIWGWRLFKPYFMPCLPSAYFIINAQKCSDKGITFRWHWPLHSPMSWYLAIPGEQSPTVSYDPILQTLNSILLSLKQFSLDNKGAKNKYCSKSKVSLLNQSRWYGGVLNKQLNKSNDGTLCNRYLWMQFAKSVICPWNDSVAQSLTNSLKMQQWTLKFHPHISKGNIWLPEMHNNIVLNLILALKI